MKLKPWYSKISQKTCEQWEEISDWEWKEGMQKIESKWKNVQRFGLSLSVFLFISLKSWNIAARRKKKQRKERNEEKKNNRSLKHYCSVCRLVYLLRQKCRLPCEFGSCINHVDSLIYDQFIHACYLLISVFLSSHSCSFTSLVFLVEPTLNHLVPVSKQWVGRIVRVCRN